MRVWELENTFTVDYAKCVTIHLLRELNSIRRWPQIVLLSTPNGCDFSRAPGGSEGIEPGGFIYGERKTEREYREESCTRVREASRGERGGRSGWCNFHRHFTEYIFISRIKMASINTRNGALSSAAKEKYRYARGTRKKGEGEILLSRMHCRSNSFRCRIKHAYNIFRTFLFVYIHKTREFS